MQTFSTITAAILGIVIFATPQLGRAQTLPGNLPAVLPGEGLAQHDFFYAGEAKTERMLIVRGRDPARDCAARWLCRTAHVAEIAAKLFQEFPFMPFHKKILNQQGANA